MKEIILVTTEGCEGCTIMHSSIRQALTLTKKEGIHFKKYDISKIDDSLKHIRFRDFPTVIFRRNNEITRVEVGTRPYIVILRWIDIDFK